MTNSIIKAIIFSSVVFLSGCVGPRASFSENFQDNFIGTSARPTADNEARCFVLTKQYAFDSGSVTFTAPAGLYKATKKIDSGYFYYAPSSIKSSNWLASFNQDGIYLNNQGTGGNLFGRNPSGYDDRPVRGAIIPSAIFAYIKKTHC